eukprot:2093188-Heterocapsa_arctica.AAC.1
MDLFLLLSEFYTGADPAVTRSVETKGYLAICVGLAHGHDARRLRDRELPMCFILGYYPWRVWSSFPCTSVCCW